MVTTLGMKKMGQMGNGGLTHAFQMKQVQLLQEFLQLKLLVSAAPLTNMTEQCV